MAPSLTRCCARVLCCLFHAVPMLSVQFLCPVCDTWKAVRHKHGSKCSDCHNQQHRHPADAAAAATPPAAHSPPPPLFGRPSGCIDQLTIVERTAIVTLHKLGWLHKDIALRIPCSEKTVSRWVRRWEEERSLADAARSGRPRCTDEDTDVAMEGFAEEKKFVTPRDIRRELQLHCSARTVRRRLDEVNLFGRVAREADSYDERTLTERIAIRYRKSHSEIQSRCMLRQHRERTECADEGSEGEMERGGERERERRIESDRSGALLPREISAERALSESQTHAMGG